MFGVSTDRNATILERDFRAVLGAYGCGSHEDGRVVCERTLVRTVLVRSLERDGVGSGATFCRVRGGRRAAATPGDWRVLGPAAGICDVRDLEFPRVREGEHHDRQSDERPSG